MAEGEKVTVLFVGGPMGGESRDFAKGKIPRVVETMAFGESAGPPPAKGRYELRYVFVGDTLSEEEFRREASGV